MRAEVIFRQLGAPVPAGWRPDLHWQVEAYGGAFPCPLGVAWVADYGASSLVGAILDFVLVADQYRRQGVATLLVEQCLHRWPNLHVPEPATHAGRRFMRSLLRRGVPIVS